MIKSFAVALNMKARKVRKSTLEMLGQHVDVEDLYITQTIEQSDRSLDEIIEKRYPLVLCGGGDGTAMRIIEQMRRKVEEHRAAGEDCRMPRFGLLKLGTGNGWAGLLRVPRKVKPIWALRQMRPEDLRFTEFNMIETEDRLFHFGGFGADAMILNDYINLKNRFSSGPLWKMANSIAGYLWATFAVAVPRVAIKKWRINVRVINNSDEPVYRVTYSGGEVEAPVKKGEVLFAAPTLIASVGTTENYGFDLKIFPYACRKKGYMHLRLTDTPVLPAMRRLRDIWTGKWESPNLHDFLVKDIIIESDEEMPFQLGGDPEGYRKSARFKVSDFLPDVLDFRKIEKIREP